MTAPSPRVLLLKTPKEDGHDPYLKILRAKEFDAECVGVLGFQFINLDKLHNRLTQHESYSAVVLTSQRAAEAIDLAMKDEPETAWKKLPAYVVGKATGKLAEELGFEIIKGADTGNAENLGNSLTSDLSDSSKMILFPCGNLRKETLPEILKKNKIRFEDVTVYETTADNSLRDNLRNYLSKGHPEFVVFFSPSGVQFTSNLWEELGISRRLFKCVAIGPTTEVSLRENGYSVVATASQPTPESVLEAITSIRV